MDLVQIQEKLASLSQELESLRFTCESEKRSQTEDEKKRTATILDEIDALKTRADEIELEERMAASLAKIKEVRRKTPASDIIKHDQKKGFRNLGEQLTAVYHAGISGAVDPRLYTRAITGMSESIPADGGFLIDTDFSKDLLRRVYETGLVVSRADKISVGPNSNGLKINAVAETSRAAGSRWGGILGYWATEAGTKTASAPKFRQMELSLKKLVGLCYATDELLADSSALEGVISSGFAEEFGFLLDDALINGTGVGQPLGIMNAACLVGVGRNTASTVHSEDIIGMWAQLYGKCWPKAVWFINQDVIPQLSIMNLGDLANTVTATQLTYMPPGGLSQSPYATLMGRPVIPIEQCPSMTAKGSVILADFSEYLLIDKGGIQSASSIHVRFVNDESCFRFVYRVNQDTSAPHISNDMVNSSLIRGTLNDEQGNPEPSKGYLPWACVETIQEPAYLN